MRPLSAGIVCSVQESRYRPKMKSSLVRSKGSLDTFLAMKGGHGSSSYACNSVIERRFGDAIRPILQSFVTQTTQALLEGAPLKPQIIRVADTGCATGANTYTAVHTIVRHARACFLSRSVESPPEFQAYFCDLPANDFNSLLRNLPPPVLPPNCKDDTISCYPSSRSYFAAAVSGSHHRRLLPTQSLHFCHSSIALHWLSRVPPEVEDRKSRAWNAGRIFVSSDEVAEAYLNQFKSDFSSFLQCRAEEIVAGGGMFVALLGRRSSAPRNQEGLGQFIGPMEVAFKDIITEGLIEERVVDEFNVPIFAPTVEEIEKIIEEEKSFEKKDVKLLTGFPLQTITEVKEKDEMAFGVSEEMLYRSLMENIVGQHLKWDAELVDSYFERIRKRASENPNEFLQQKIDILVACLVRRSEDWLDAKAHNGCEPREVLCE